MGGQQVNSINWGNTIVFAFGGAGTAFFISICIGLVLLLLVDYNETIISLMRTSNWALPLIGAVVGGILGAVQKETSRF